MHLRKPGKYVRYVLWCLPLAGAFLSSFAPITARSQQFLVLIMLIWFQTFIIVEVFLSGR